MSLLNKIQPQRKSHNVLGKKTQVTLDVLYKHFLDNLDEDSDINEEIDLTIGYFSCSWTTKNQILECKKLLRTHINNVLLGETVC